MNRNNQWLFETLPTIKTAPTLELETFPLNELTFRPTLDAELENVFSSVFGKIENVVNWGKERIIVSKAIQTGNRDENQLTNLVFFSRHPERQGRKLSKTEPNFQQLSQEWLEILNLIVRPLLKQIVTGIKTNPSSARPSSVTGNCIRQGSCSACENRLTAGNPAQLVPVPKELTYKGKNIPLDPLALAAYKALYAAARAAGISSPYLQIFSGFRDYDHQASLWRKRLLKKFQEFGCGSTSMNCVAYAIDRTTQALKNLPVPHPKNIWRDRFLKELKGCSVSCDPRAVIEELRKGTAPPGNSSHQTGKTVDIYLGSAPGYKPDSRKPKNVEWQRAQPQYQWLVCNAGRYGFYPYLAEPWHWEYNPTPSL